MRLSDLLKDEVVDSRGERAGHVHDVRLVQDGPLQGAFGAAFRVHGLIVGKGSFGTRLGYGRSDMKGPWLIKSFFHLFHRDARIVEWDQIRSIEPGLVRLRVRKDELREVGSLGPASVTD